MKKFLLFFVILSAVLFTGCSNDAYNESGSARKQFKRAHWYGIKQLQDSVSLRSAVDRMKLWTQDPVITVKFLNSLDDPTMLDQIKSYAKEWEMYAGVTFQFVEASENALVRIGFDWEENSWLTWSYTGNEAKMVRNQSEPTACFGGFNDGVMSDEEIKGDVLRVFGQILGLEFEQRHRGWDPSWWKKDKNGVYYAEKYWAGMFDGYYENLDWETIRLFVFEPLASATVVQTADVDFESIMMWPYYTKKETVKLYANYKLSEGDKQFIGTLYPKKEGNSIQTAWVDAGYFVWTNAEKNQLSITEKGARMEVLPDVIDGQQLTSTDHMFYYYVYGANTGSRSVVKLKKAPMFNTSNVVNFTGMFYSCRDLIEIPRYDTSSGKIMSGMFNGCISLKQVPALNISGCIDFSTMFQDSGITEIPPFDFSKGQIFIETFSNTHIQKIVSLELPEALSVFRMFQSCKFLKTVDSFKAPKAIDARLLFANSKVEQVSGLIMHNVQDILWMFSDCKYLKKVSNVDLPNLGNCSGLFVNCISLEEVESVNVAKSENFDSFFYGCKSLKRVADVLTSNSKSFSRFFEDCVVLEDVPLLDTSQAEDLTNMFNGCVKLQSIPLLNTANVRYFGRMFYNCSNFESIPLLNTSQGESFSDMFYNCSQLKSIPTIDTSNGRDLSGMFRYCRNLTKVSPLNTSNCENFGAMFYECNSLEKIPFLDTSKGKYFLSMFEHCVNLKEVHPMDLSKGCNFAGMFRFHSKMEDLKISNFGIQDFKLLSSVGAKQYGSLDISSPVLDVSSLQYLIDNTTGGSYNWTVSLNRALKSKVSAELITQAAAKNIKFEFIY